MDPVINESETEKVLEGRSQTIPVSTSDLCSSLDSDDVLEPQELGLNNDVFNNDAPVHVESFQIPHLRLFQECSDNPKNMGPELVEDEGSQIVKKELLDGADQADDEDIEDDDYFDESEVNEFGSLPIAVDIETSNIDRVDPEFDTQEVLFVEPDDTNSEVFTNHVINDPGLSNNSKPGISRTAKSTSCCNCNERILGEAAPGKNFNEFLPLQYFNTLTGDYTDVQIIDALSDIFKIRWTYSGFGDICKRDDLSLCLECASTLAQLYRMYNQFAAVAIKAKSFLSEIINFQKDLQLDSKRSNLNESEDAGFDNETNVETGESAPEQQPVATWKRTRRVKKVQRYVEQDDDSNASSNDINSDMENSSEIIPVPSPVQNRRRKRKPQVLVEDSENENPTVSTNNRIPLKKRKSSNKLGENVANEFTVEKIDTQEDGPFVPLQQTDENDGEEEDEGNESLQLLLRKITDSDGKKKSLRCKECKKDFKFEIQLRIHLNSKKHKVKKLRLNDEDESPTEDKRKTRNRKSDLKGAKSKFNQCRECDKDFATSKDLAKHNKIHHDPKIIGDCDRCGKKFKTLGGLKIHYAAHVRDDNKYSCKDCGKKFRKKDALELHEKTDHGGFKPHVCTVCDKRFRLKDKLKLHMMVIHEKKKPFPCPKCEKSFRTKYHLKIHDVSQHIQGGDTSIGCSQCKRKFPDRDALEKHVIVHEQEKPYVCSMCTKGFHTSARLKLHEKSHQEVPSCLCPVCGRAYKHIRDLKLHEVIHQDESTYRFGCGDCPRRFYRIDLLRVHQSNEKHFSSEVIGPTVSKSLTSNKDVSYFQIKEDMLDEDEEDENETDDNEPPPPPPKKKKKKLTPRERPQQKLHHVITAEREMKIIHPHTVIYHPSSMVQVHLDQSTTVVPVSSVRNDSIVSANSGNNLSVTAHHPRYIQEAHGSTTANYIMTSRDRQNPSHYSGIQIQPVSSTSHPHIQFGSNTVYTMRDERGNPTLNVANVAGAEQIGFDIITSFINNLG